MPWMRTDARQKLESMHLGDIVAGLGRRSRQNAAKPVTSLQLPLRGEDFLVFNQQLAPDQCSGGLPVEQELRLVAQEMLKGSMRQTLDLVAAELESWKNPCPRPWAGYRTNFPPLYSELIDAGIRAGNLSGILLNLGNHLDAYPPTARAMLWRKTLSYPVVSAGGIHRRLIFQCWSKSVPKWEPFIGMPSAECGTGCDKGGDTTPLNLRPSTITRLLFAVSDAVAEAVPGVVVVFYRRCDRAAGVGISARRPATAA